MNEPSTLTELEHLLSAPLESIVASCGSSGSVMETRLQKNKTLFEQKCAGITPHTPESINGALRAKILAIEEALTKLPQWRGLTEKDALKNTVRAMYALCPSSEKRGFFLKEIVASRILRKLPPTQMYKHVAKKELDALSPLSILVLTRFTETKEWQDAYLNELAKLSPRHFTMREMRSLVVDSNAFAGVLKLAGEKQKPWRISHNKEAGIIVCFTLDEAHNLPAPLTQYVAVYLHYFFEVGASAQFANHIRYTNPKNIGSALKQVIRSHDHKFPFFHPNAYSEHLFWERALTLFVSAFPDIAELQYFANTIDCGGEIEGTPVSLNMVDHLWNINLAHLKTTREYFGEDRISFLYHFREGLWYDLFRELMGQSREESARSVTENLHLGDVPYTAYAIAKKNPL